MKKITRIISLALTLALVLSTLGITVAFADSSSFRCPEFGPPFQSIKLWGRHADYFTVNDSSITLSAKSSDESVVGTEMVKDEQQNRYILYLSGYKNGKASVTVTASDGTSDTNDVIVEGNVPYSISSDTTRDFTLSKNNSYVMKIHLVSSNPGEFIDPSIESDNENIIKATILDWQPNKNNDYFFRIDTVGSVGQSATLSIGGSTVYIHNKVCKVTIGANKNLRLDTTTKYTCDVGATYSFIAYTSSTSIPKVSVYNNDLMTAKYEKKVAGGYLYKINALYPGDTSVRVTSNGESSSFPVTINYQKIISDTPKQINLNLGKSYVYKLKATGNRDPISFYASEPSSLTISSVKKVGGYYYVKVTASGKIKGGSYLLANFPSAQGKYYMVSIGVVMIPDPTEPKPKSDTNVPYLRIAKGKSYIIKITNAGFYIDGYPTPGSFKVDKVNQIGYDAYYKITAIGAVGTQSVYRLQTASSNINLGWVLIV